MAHLPVTLTKTRVEALLAVAGRGATDVVFEIQDDYGVDITKESADIRRQISAQRKEFPDLFGESELQQIWQAVHEHRQYQAARAILHRRYIA